jgi:hypothetical protein
MFTIEIDHKHELKRGVELVLGQLISKIQTLSYA